MRGEPGNQLKLELVDGDTRFELKTVTRLEVDADGATLTLWIPELEADIALPDTTGQALVDIERLRAKQFKCERCACEVPVRRVTCGPCTLELNAAEWADKL